MMDKLMRTLYLYFYKEPDMRAYNLAKQVKTPAVLHPKSIEKLFRYDGTRAFVEKYVVFGSQLYFKFLEIKSKEAREAWGREAIHHLRDIKNIRRGKKWEK
jgi:hypothetical protein